MFKAAMLASGCVLVLMFVVVSFQLPLWTDDRRDMFVGDWRAYSHAGPDESHWDVVVEVHADGSFVACPVAAEQSFENKTLAFLAGRVHGRWVYRDEAVFVKLNDGAALGALLAWNATPGEWRSLPVLRLEERLVHLSVAGDRYIAFHKTSP